MTEPVVLSAEAIVLGEASKLRYDPYYIAKYVDQSAKEATYKVKGFLSRVRWGDPMTWYLIVVFLYLLITGAKLIWQQLRQIKGSSKTCKDGAVT